MILLRPQDYYSGTGPFIQLHRPAQHLSIIMRLKIFTHCSGAGLHHCFWSHAPGNSKMFCPQRSPTPSLVHICYWYAKQPINRLNWGNHKCLFPLCKTRVIGLYTINDCSKESNKSRCGLHLREVSAPGVKQQA